MSNCAHTVPQDSSVCEHMFECHTDVDPSVTPAFVTNNIISLLLVMLASYASNFETLIYTHQGFLYLGDFHLDSFTNLIFAKIFSIGMDP